LTGAFSYTDSEMWRAVLVLSMGVASVLGAAFVGERVIAGRRPRAVARPRFRGANGALAAIVAWTVGSLALTLIMSAYGIGRTGIVNQMELPFHLNGALILARAYMVPSLGLLILDMLIRNGLRSYAKIMVLSLIGVGFVCALTALSRGYLGILLITVALYFAINAGRCGITSRVLLRYALGVTVPLVFAVFFITQLRVYGFGGQSVGIGSATSLAKSIDLNNPGEAAHLLISLATSRVGGLQELLGVLSAPDSWHLSNPYQFFMEHGDDIALIQKNVTGFVSDRDGVVATGQSLGLWGTLFLSGSPIVMCLGTMIYVLLSIGIEETFLRLNAGAVALSVTVEAGITLWGFATYSHILKIVEIAVVVFLAISFFIRHFAVTHNRQEA